MAKFGKIIQFNANWNRTNGEHVPNICSALVLSSVFNDKFFVDKYRELFTSEDGISTIQENLLLHCYF